MQRPWGRGISEGQKDVSGAVVELLGDRGGQGRQEAHCKSSQASKESMSSGRSAVRKLQERTHCLAQ